MVEKLEIIRCDKCRGKITPNPVSFHYEIRTKQRGLVHICERCLGVFAYQMLSLNKVGYSNVLKFISDK